MPGVQVSKTFLDKIGYPPVEGVVLRTPRGGNTGTPLVRLRWSGGEYVRAVMDYGDAKRVVAHFRMGHAAAIQCVQGDFDAVPVLDANESRAGRLCVNVAKSNTARHVVGCVVAEWRYGGRRSGGDILAEVVDGVNGSRRLADRIWALENVIVSASPDDPLYDWKWDTFFKGMVIPDFEAVRRGDHKAHSEHGQNRNTHIGAVLDAAGLEAVECEQCPMPECSPGHPSCRLVAAGLAKLTNHYRERSARNRRADT